MADKKISELTAATAGIVTGGSVMPATIGGTTYKVTRDVLMGGDTVHFNIGNIGSLGLAPTAGVANPSALAYFGQINVERAKTITAIHLHTIEGGTGVDLAVDVFRRRSSTMTLIGQVSLSGTVTDYGFDSAVPTAGVAAVQAGDYLFAQATAATLGTLDGLTVDIHFDVA